jgi:putative PIN family toxin of toxin-antitoxin system
MPFIVVDANVLVSAAIAPRGVPGRTVDRCERRYTIAHTPETFGEYRRILLDSKFDRMLSRRERTRAIGAIRRMSQFFRVDAGPAVGRDPRDDVYLHLAVVSAAAVIVSGDRDLIVLGSFSGIPILSPSRFLRAERSIRRGRQDTGG